MSRVEKAIEKAVVLYGSANNVLKSATLEDLKTKGLTDIQANSVMTVINFSLVCEAEKNTYNKSAICSSSDAYSRLKEKFINLSVEKVGMLCLSRSNQVIAYEEISIGGISGCVVDPKVVFQKALKHKRCTAIILAHNHPSGNLMPSQADKAITRKVKSGGEFLDIGVLDHLIITDDDYISMADNGDM